MGRYVNYLAKHQAELKAVRPEAVNVPFIANHDTDRAAGYLPVSNGRMQMAANLYLLAPGSPFIYYGEEIGLKGARGGASSDANRRLAMRWGDGDTVKNPVGSSYEEKNQVNGTVAEQLAAEGSLLKHYQKIIALRKAHPAIARGSYRPLALSDIKAGGFVAEWQDQAVCVLHNTSRSTERIPLSALSTEYRFDRIEGVLGLGEVAIEEGELVIGGLTSLVLTPSP